MNHAARIRNKLRKAGHNLTVYNAGGFENLVVIFLDGDTTETEVTETIGNYPAEIVIYHYED